MLNFKILPLVQKPVVSALRCQNCYYIDVFKLKWSVEAENGEGAKVKKGKMEVTEEHAKVKKSKQNLKDSHFNGTVVYLTNSALWRK